jgi:hypothetical protein
MMLFITHRFNAFIHTLLTGKNASEQGFSYLSTDITRGYYDYLYIYKTRSQTNPTTPTHLIGLSISSINMKDFQLKKLRATA